MTQKIEVASISGVYWRKKSVQTREILSGEPAWGKMPRLFAPSIALYYKTNNETYFNYVLKILGKRTSDFIILSRKVCIINIHA